MPGERRVSARQGWAGEKSDFFSILLGEIQTQEYIVLSGEVQAGSVAGETGNDAAMLLAQPGRFKSLSKVLPARGDVGGEARAFRRWQSMNRGREGTNGLLDTLIRRSQLELGVECFKVMAEFLAKRQSVIGCGGSRF